jgi:hypothetical protein
MKTLTIFRIQRKRIVKFHLNEKINIIINGLFMLENDVKITESKCVWKQARQEVRQHWFIV